MTPVALDQNALRNSLRTRKPRQFPMVLHLPHDEAAIVRCDVCIQKQTATGDSLPQAGIILKNGTTARKGKHYLGVL